MTSQPACCTPAASSELQPPIAMTTASQLQLPEAFNDAVGRKWNYQVDSPVGAGAFGIVWCAIDDSNGKKLAIKKLTGVLSTTLSARRTHSELKALTLLEHDNLLSAKEFILEPNSCAFSDVYIISELMDTDLHRIIQSAQKLSTSHVQLFFYQMLRGLKYLHSSGIIHRDIKPANMLVNTACNLKIGDFGLACSESMTETSTAAAANSFEAPGGTLSYLAPELLLGLRSYGPSIDIWSAGCVLAELLTRKVLFNTSSSRQQLELAFTLLGTPQGLEDFQGISEWAERYLKQRMTSSSCRRSFLSNMIPNADPRVSHLLARMLTMSPRQRMSASQILSQAYVTAGRQLYHNKLCTCCRRAQTDANIEGVHQIDVERDRKLIEASNGNEALQNRFPLDSNYLDPIRSAPISIGFNQSSTIEDFKVAIYDICSGGRPETRDTIDVISRQLDAQTN